MNMDRFFNFRFGRFIPMKYRLILVICCICKVLSNESSYAVDPISKKIASVKSSNVSTNPSTINVTQSNSFEIAQQIDQFIEIGLAKEKIIPADQVEDELLLRRLTLDLVGRIPTRTEWERWRISKSPSKRGEFVDELMNSPDFERHFANQLSVMFSTNRSRPSETLRQFFEYALHENWSWDKIFHELLDPPQLVTAPNPGDKGKKKNASTISDHGASDFIRSRVKEIDRLTNDTSVLFFGVNISCAQCHHHPLVHDWKMDHYYGLKTFLFRTVELGNYIGEKQFGTVKFQPPKGESRLAKMMFLTGQVVDDPGLHEPNKEESKKMKEWMDKAKKDNTPPTPLAFSPRKKLIELALSEKNRGFFARNIVNRIWYLVMGYGLVMPIDQLHSENPSNHPELFDYLTEKMIQNNYNFRFLIRSIVLSKTYSRSSRYLVQKSAGKESGDQNASKSPLGPEPQTFAVAQVKPLTPAQLGLSLKIANIDPERWAKLKKEDYYRQIQSARNESINLYDISPPGSTEDQIGVSESLFFSNNAMIQDRILNVNGDSLIGNLIKKKNINDMVQLAFQTVFCREPTKEELKACSQYLDKRKNQLDQALRQVIWAMVTSSEFRFNY